MGLRSASGGERGDRIKKVPPWKCQPKDGEQLGAPRQYNTVNLTYLGPTVKDTLPEILTHYNQTEINRVLRSLKTSNKITVKILL